MTIVDIAKESGYSVTTVSRVLNDRKDVSPEARKKIMEIVEAHGCVPNNNAKRLKQSISKNVLVLVKGTSNMLFASIIEDIQSVIDETGYTLTVTYLDEDDNIGRVTITREYIEGTGGPIIDIRSNEILEPVENLKQIPVEEK